MPESTLDGSLRADVGVIGGSGFYAFLDDAVEVAVETPFGPPSDTLAVGHVGGRAVAFLPRHGREHRLAPHRIDYRANLWALRSVGVRQVIAPCAVGSLRAELAPGTLLVPDQVVDRTWGRPSSLFDDTPPVHVGRAEPYCPRGRAAVVDAARSRSLDPVDGGTLVVINGPRFSTRAESAWHAAQGWSVVGMTGMPEAAIARELALCYTAIALVTDHDAGVQGGEPVTHEQVMRVFTANIDALRGLLHQVAPALPAPDEDCACRHPHDGVKLPFALP
jgi:5'-methylthioadenosine phosphorylase